MKRKNSTFTNVMIALMFVAIIFVLMKLGFNLFSGIVIFIILFMTAGIITEVEKNKANAYLAQKYDEENK